MRLLLLLVLLLWDWVSWALFSGRPGSDTRETLQTHSKGKHGRARAIFWIGVWTTHLRDVHIYWGCPSIEWKSFRNKPHVFSPNWAQTQDVV